MMRLFFGFVAIVFAAATAAFTTPQTNLNDAIFAFDYANHSPTLANVQDESKWILVQDMEDCPDGESRACKIKVAPAQYSGSTLSSSANIQALESATGVAYVNTAVALEIVNRSNP